MKPRNFMSFALVLFFLSLNVQSEDQAPPTLDEYVAWATELANEYGESVDKNRLIATYEFEQYKIALDILTDQFEVLEQEAQNAKNILANPTRDIFIEELGKLKSHLQADKDAIGRVTLVDLSDAAIRSELKTLFREHIALHRAAVLTIDLGLFAVHAVPVLKELRIDEGKFGDLGVRTWEYINLSILRYLGESREYPKGHPLHPISSSCFLRHLNSLWSTTVKNENYETFPPQFEKQFELDVEYLFGNIKDYERFNKIDLVLSVVALVASAGEMTLALPETLVSLRNFLNVASNSQKILKFLSATTGSGVLGSISIANGGRYFIGTLEEATALIKARGLRATATSALVLAMAGGNTPRPVNPKIRQKAVGQFRNSAGEEYPAVKVAGTDRPVPSPTAAQIQALKRVGPPSPPFPDSARQQFKNWWEANNGLPSSYANWNEFWDAVNIHHIIPRSLGGTHEFTNLVPVLRGAEHQKLTNWWQAFIR